VKAAYTRTEDGVAVINIHHMNKGGVYGGKSGFGSIIWQKWVRETMTGTVGRSMAVVTLSSVTVVDGR
jgi:hypothetical protein